MTLKETVRTIWEHLMHALVHLSLFTINWMGLFWFQQLEARYPVKGLGAEFLTALHQWWVVVSVGWTMLMLFASMAKGQAASVWGKR